MLHARPKSLWLAFLIAAVSAFGARAGVTQNAQPAFSMAQVLGYPYPTDLIAAPDGNAIAWVLDQRGVRNVWIAKAPDYRPRLVTRYTSDSGQEITQLRFSHDGSYLVFVRGGDHDANWPEKLPPDPDSNPVEPKIQVWSVSLASGEPHVLGEGDHPAISPRDNRVAFVHPADGSVWWAPIDGSHAPQQLFFDRGKDSDLQWSPTGDALAFVSGRDDHSFIGIFRNDSTPLEYLAPSTAHDRMPRWSPDGSRIVFARTPGSGGAPQSPLDWHPLPWSILVGDAKTGEAHVIWNSPDTLRGSFPQEGGGVDLHWVAGDRIAFMSEMDNWPHLYTVSARGGNAQLLTPGDFMIEDVAFAPDGKSIIYSANAGNTPGDSDRRHLYQVSVAGGAPEPLSSGAHSQWSPVVTGEGSGLAFVDAGPRRPPLVMQGTLVSRRWQPVDAQQIPADFPTKELIAPRLVSFKAADGWTIQGQLFEKNTGTAKKPGIIFVHGGPPRQMLLTWHNMDYYSNAYAVNQYLASRGFIVLSVNYRLSIGYGQDFHYPPHWGPTGASEYQDVLAGARYLQQYPGVNPAKIGIWGGSYGGYLTALGLARNSDVFKAGVDFHGVHDWSMFAKDWFGQSPERYQELDKQSLMKVFWDSSPDSAIATWKSPVLLIQGDDDRNVHFHQMVDLVRRLQAAHVPYQELVIPNEIHGFLRYHSWLEADRATARFFQAQFFGNAQP